MPNSVSSYLEHPAKQRVPSIPNTGFCSLVDPVFKEWIDVWQTGSRGDGATLERALFDRLLAKLTEFRPEEPNAQAPGDQALAACDLMEGRLSLLGLPPVEIGNPVNWFAEFETESQWNAHLGYFYGFNSLVSAHRETGDEKFAERWFEIVEDFIDRVPYGSGDLRWFPSRPMVLNDTQSCDNGENAHDSPIHWISLSCHMRSEAWLDGLIQFASSSALTPVRLEKILASLYGDHFLCLVNNPRENTPNQFISTSASLLRLGLMFPGLRNASAAFLIGQERFERAIRNVMFPDGSDLEQSPNYNAGLLAKIRHLIGMLEQAGAAEGRIKGLRDDARRRAAFLNEMFTPDGRMVDIAKAHAATGDRRKIFSGCGDLVPANTHLSASMPWGGYTVLRSGWGAHDDYMLFKSSRLGVGHAHEDCLSIILYARGRRLLVDSGNFSYSEQSEKDRLLNAYCLSTRSHSSILIDGEGQNRRFLLKDKHPGRKMCDVPPLRASEMPPLGDACGSGGPFTFVEGRYEDGYGPERVNSFKHLRRVVWIEGEGWIVVDFLLAEARNGSAHHFTQAWMLAPEFPESSVQIRQMDGITFCEASLEDTKITILSGSAQSAAVYSGKMDEVATGWFCPEYGVAEPKCDVHFRWKGAGTQCVLTYIAVSSLDKPTPSLAKISGNTWRITSDKEWTVEMDATGGIEISGNPASLTWPAGSPAKWGRSPDASQECLPLPIVNS